MSDVWLPTWPGSENTILLSIANHLIHNDLYNKEFVRKWVHWKEFLQYIQSSTSSEWDSVRLLISNLESPLSFETFDKRLHVRPRCCCSSGLDPFPENLTKLADRVFYFEDGSGLLMAKTWPKMRDQSASNTAI